MIERRFPSTTKKALAALDLGRRRADERIARLILRLADKVAKRTQVRTATFDFPLRQRHIADATGLTPVHVSKVMGELQRAGPIEVNSRSLTIVNPAELQRVADWRGRRRQFAMAAGLSRRHQPTTIDRRPCRLRSARSSTLWSSNCCTANRPDRNWP